ncbi:MAG: hypothetical protein ACRD6X_17250, partial [Pyrinomonadaceae bacterium]
MRKPARKQGRNIQLGCIALAHARASAKKRNLMSFPLSQRPNELPHRSVADQCNFHNLFKIHFLHQFNKPRLIT